MVRALANKVDLFRPSKASGYDGAITYSKTVLSGIKLAQNARGWTVDSSGAMRMSTATLYFNVGHSTQIPALVPTFKEGDIICVPSSASEPSADRLTVQTVTEQTFKGALHHYEVVLT